MATEPTPTLPIPALAVLGALVLVLVGGFLALVLTDRDTSTYTLFVAGPLVTSAIGAILSQRVAKVEQIATKVQRQTDGQLTAQLEGLHDHLNAQTTEIVESLPAAPANVSPVSSSGSPGVPGQRSDTVLGPFASRPRP